MFSGHERPNASVKFGIMVLDSYRSGDPRWGVDGIRGFDGNVGHDRVFKFLMATEVEDAAGGAESLAGFPARIGDHFSVHDCELNRTISEERRVKGSVVIIRRIPDHLEFDRGGFERADECSPAIVASGANVGFSLLDRKRYVFDVLDLDPSWRAIGTRIAIELGFESESYHDFFINSFLRDQSVLV